MELEENVLHRQEWNTLVARADRCELRLIKKGYREGKLRQTHEAIVRESLTPFTIISRCIDGFYDRF